MEWPSYINFLVSCMVFVVFYSWWHISDAQYFAMPEIGDDEDEDVEDDDDKLIIFPLTDFNYDSGNSSDTERLHLSVLHSLFVW